MMRNSWQSRRARPVAAGVFVLIAALVASAPAPAAGADDVPTKQQLEQAIEQLEQQFKEAKTDKAEHQQALDEAQQALAPFEKRVDSARKAADAAAELHRLLKAELDEKKQDRALAQKEADAANTRLLRIQSALNLAKQSLAATAPMPWTKSAPESLDDLRGIEQRVQQLVEKLVPVTVGLIVGNARGSGVIISSDGYVLTAGHVSSTPGRDVRVILHDGRVVSGKTLGRNTGIDSGLIKITAGEEWDFAEMGTSGDLEQGDWCVALGHPGGYQRGRPPVLRIGRIIRADDRVVWTDCTLVGGDSGGPLFNMDGKVIGIHSRISAPTTANFHVPIDTYTDTWDRLAKGDDWTDRQVNIGAVAGFHGGNHDEGVRVTDVIEGGPAGLAGLAVGDIITRFDGRRARNTASLVGLLNRKRPTDEADIAVLRDGKVVNLKVTLAAGFPAGPFLGVSGLDHDKGAAVQSIVPGTPAADAGLQPNDVIVKLDGKGVKNLAELQGAIGDKKPGDSVEIEIIRDGKVLKLSLELGMRG